MADEIKELLNNKVASEANREVKQSISIYAESTPNPNAMKFVANKKLTTQPLLFDKIEQTKEAPMISKLFKYEFVKEVFIDENYILFVFHIKNKKCTGPTQRMKIIS